MKPMMSPNGKKPNEPAIRVQNLSRTYHLEGEDIHAVNDVTIDIWSNQMTAIVGRSGSGKTTLLNLIAGLDDPTKGEVWVAGKHLLELDEKSRLALRRDTLGFVFQSFGLLPLLTAAENVGVPLRMRNMAPPGRGEGSGGGLNWVELTQRPHHRPHDNCAGNQHPGGTPRASRRPPRTGR